MFIKWPTIYKQAFHVSCKTTKINKIVCLNRLIRVIECWELGNRGAECWDAAWDITVVQPLQASMVARAATTPGHGAQEAFKRKWKAAGDQCFQEGIVFFPSPWRAQGDGTRHKVKKLGGALARHTGAKESTSVRHLFQRLSVLLVKGNSDLVVNCEPSP